jgi:hypothetical protein
MLKFLSWLAIAGVCLSCPVQAADGSYLQELIRKAHAEQLSQTPQWHALIHYHENLILPGVTGQADDDKFYNAPEGKTDPAAELDATLAAFFAAPIIETDKTQHPQCVFIARYLWLKQVLDFDPARLPEQPCKRFRKWRTTLNPTALTLVFPSAYINNPSSMFGHTLLRVDAADQNERTRLLAYAINYSVGDPDSNGVLFIVKSLIGAYPGLFSMSPYYIKVKEYSDLENRDIWEYRLNFTAEEIDRLLMHVWELGPVKFDYYFFDENCSYHLLSLFDVARPSLGLTKQFRGWAIPVDTVRTMVEEAGLVGEAVYRPANATRLRTRLESLNDTERELANLLAKSEISPSDASITHLPKDKQVAVLETAYADLRYRDDANKPDHAMNARQSHELLVARSRLPVVAQTDEPAAPATRPDQGHPTRRIAIGIGHNDWGMFQELRLRPAYHDQLDPSGGYSEGAQINFVDIAARHYQDSNRFLLEKLSLVDIVSLAPRDRFFKPISWKINTGLARERLAENDKDNDPVFRANGGAGFAVSPWSNAMLYGLLEGTLDVGGAQDDHHALGIGPSIGLLASPNEWWKLNLFMRYQRYFTGEEDSEREITLEQSFTIDHQNAVRLNASYKHEHDMDWTSVGLEWHVYF